MVIYPFINSYSGYSLNFFFFPSQILGPNDLSARLQYRLWRSSTTGPRTKRLTSLEFEALKV